MKNRVISTVTLWLIILLVLFFMGAPAGAILLTILSGLAQYEYYQLAKKGGFASHATLGIILGSFLILGAYFLPKIELFNSVNSAGLLIVEIVIYCIVVLFMSGTNNKFITMITTLSGIIYFPLLLCSFVNIILLFHNERIGLFIAVWVVIIAKFTDVGAYLIGSKFGRNKLVPKISPKKTWEGAIGGVLISISIATFIFLIFNRSFPVEFNLINVMLIACFVSIVSIFSDLFESLIKREVKVKDSGNIIPGIGGAFDLMDSLLFAAPLAYLLIKFILLV